jgi:hypothetical protein
MATLTPEQVKKYYAEEGTKANPLSATDWLAKQTTNQFAPTGYNPQYGTPLSPDYLAKNPIPNYIGETPFSPIGTNPTPPPATPTPPSGDTTPPVWWSDYLKTQPTETPMEQYTNWQSTLGIPQAQQAVTSATQKYNTTEQDIQTVQNQLDDLEKNINSRIQGQDVTEAMRQRYLAVEQKAPMQQLQTLQRLAATELGGVQSAQAALTPLQSELNTIMPLVTAQTPQQKMAEYVAQQAAQQQFQAQPTITTGGGIYQYNPATGKYDKYVGPAATTSVSTSGADTITTDKGIYQWNPTTKKYDIFVGNKPAASTDLTESEKEKVAITDMASNLNKVTGTDGYISPENWKKAKNAWVSEGLNADDFIKSFSQFINPGEKRDWAMNYGVAESNFLWK